MVPFYGLDENGTDMWLLLPLYTLTRICSVRYTKRVELVFEMREAGFVDSTVDAQRPIHTSKKEEDDRSRIHTGSGAMKFGGWQRLNAEYVRQFGMEPTSLFA